MTQRDLFEQYDLLPTPAMESGDSTVWQCHWCGTLVCQPRIDKPALCPCCQLDDGGWTKIEAVGGRYAGPFRDPYMVTQKHSAQAFAAYLVRQVCTGRPVLDDHVAWIRARVEDAVVRLFDERAEVDE